MLVAENPYFMSDETWYFYDVKSFQMKLTDKGKEIDEVVKSYEDFYKKQLDQYEDSEHPISLRELDRIKHKDGREGTVMLVLSDDKAFDVEFDDADVLEPETEIVELTDIL